MSATAKEVLPALAGKFAAKITAEQTTVGCNQNLISLEKFAVAYLLGADPSRLDNEAIVLAAYDDHKLDKTIELIEQGRIRWDNKKNQWHNGVFRAVRI